MRAGEDAGLYTSSKNILTSIFVHDDFDAASLTLFEGRQIIGMCRYIEWVRAAWIFPGLAVIAPDQCRSCGGGDEAAGWT
jgi:hypothetical protein